MSPFVILRTHSFVGHCKLLTHFIKEMAIKGKIVILYKYIIERMVKKLLYKLVKCQYADVICVNSNLDYKSDVWDGSMDE